MKRVVVAMSGGVDSSLAAALTAEAGYEAVGVTMKLLPGDRSSTNILDARKICDRLGLRHYTVSFEDVFESAVLRVFAEETRRGRTPNPCVECNRQVKFGALLDWADRWGAEYIATGHYARTSREAGGETLLLRASNEAKDQSYFLYTLSQRELSRTLFPIGAMSKPEVRRRCRELGFATADKPQSQDLCFPSTGLRGPGRPGDIRDSSGNLLGTHQGLSYYTVGQRRGLGLGTQGSPRAGRMYVMAMDAKTNTLVVGEPELTEGRRFLVRNLRWTRPANAVRCRAGVRIRHRAPIIDAELAPAGPGGLEVCLSRAQRAIAPGQAAVFYEGDEVLGGGTIEEAR